MSSPSSSASPRSERAATPAEREIETPRRVREMSETYKDPEADVVLRATDGTLFRVHSFVLKASSTFFHDMLRSPIINQSNTDPDNVPAIPLSASPAAMTLLLDLMRNTPTPADVDFQSYNNVLALSDELGCQIVKERIMHRLYSAPRSKSWDVFKLASQQDNVELARAALANLREDPRYDKLDVTGITLEMMEGVRPSYLVGWLRTRSVFHGRGLRNESLDDQQARMARAFKPIK